MPELSSTLVDSDEILDAEVEEGRHVCLDVPQSSREAAIQQVLAYYSPSAENAQSTTHESRREAAIVAIVDQVRSAGSFMQESYMRALKVHSMLENGTIERLPADQMPEDSTTPSAASRYADAVRADSRLAMRLMQKVGAENPAQPGESMDDYFGRLTGIDFALGYAACEYPHLFESATQAQADLRCDRDGVVDEDRIARENIHLIEQALKLHLRAEESVLGVAQESDAVDVQALGLTFGELTSGSDEATPDEYPRER